MQLSEVELAVWRPHDNNYATEELYSDMQIFANIAIDESSETASYHVVRKSLYLK